MTRSYALFAVEGPSDQVIVRNVLRRILGFNLWDGKIDELHDLWPRTDDIVPDFSSKAGNVYRRVALPSILYSDSMSIAVFEGEGSSLINRLKALFLNHSLHDKLSAFAVFADSDKALPVDVALRYQRELVHFFAHFPTQPGQVVNGPPKLGVFVFPDNRNQGVVEHLVLECGEIVYSELLQRAVEYVHQFDVHDRDRERWAPFDEQKAIIASVASLLKPGKTNTVTLADNEWISERTQGVTSLGTLIDFCKELITSCTLDGQNS
jgi:hypothetical protein